VSESTLNTDGVSTSEEATFAAAIGLTPPSRSGAKRRVPKIDTSGRPLLTAETAGAAAAALGTSTPSPSLPNLEVPAAQSTARVGSPGVQGPPRTGAVPVLKPQPTSTNLTGSIPAVGIAAPDHEKVSWWKRRRMRVRRVRRTIRHVDPWSVFKISVILFACLYVAFMAAGVLLWRAAVDAGLIGRFESFLLEVGVFETFVIEGETIFRSSSIIGVVMVAAASAISVVVAILFNLISDLTGGVRVTVLEEDLGRPERIRR